MTIGSIYSDNLVDIAPDTITFKNYYFFGWGKAVPVSDIEKIESLKPSAFNGKWRIWGSSGFGRWLPMDWSRPSRDRIYYLHYKNKAFQIGFTVENSALAESALRQLGLMKE